MLKRGALNLAILLLAVAIGLMMIEFGVRIFFPHFDPSGHLKLRVNETGVPLLVGPGTYRQVKNTGDFDVTVSVNSLGLRESKPLDSSTPNDIFVVGDSFSLGWGVEVEDRYSNVLERMLSPTRVFNVSVPAGFGGYERLLRYAAAHGARIHRVIVGVCMENDLQRYGARGPLRSPPKTGAALTDLKTWLTKSSAAYFMLTAAIHATPLLREWAIKLGLIVPNLEAPHLFDLDRGAVAPSVRKLEELIAPYDQALILIIPSRALWVGTKAQRAAAAEIHEDFVGRLRKDGLQVVDPRHAMEAGGRPLSYHFKNDGHWTAAAHALAAKMLAERLR